MRQIFENSIIHKPSLGLGHARSHIGSVVLTFIEYKQTDKHTSKVYIYIDEKCGLPVYGMYNDWRKNNPIFRDLLTLYKGTVKDKLKGVYAET